MMMANSGAGAPPRFRWPRAAGVVIALVIGAKLPAQDLGLDLDEPARAGQAQAPVPGGARDGLPSLLPPLAGCTVPAFGSQRVLPDGPAFGLTTNAIDLIAARGETESASFVLRSDAAIRQLIIETGDLTSPSGRLAAATLDVRLVKCWFQSGNAWFTTAGDPDTPALIPELLLYDDSLVATLPAERRNTCRIGGVHVSMSADPQSEAVRPDDDAPVIQPLALRANEHRQFWLNVHVPASATPGIYQGAVRFMADGKPSGHLAITLRVLPFELPNPARRSDPAHPFHWILAHGLSLASLGPDRAAAEVRLHAAFTSMARQGVLHAVAPDFDAAAGDVQRELELRHEAGLAHAPLWLADAGAAAAWQFPKSETFSQEALTRAEARFNSAAKLAGHREIFYYLPTGREAPPDLAAHVEALHARGVRLWMRGDDATVNLYGHFQEIHQFGDEATPRQIQTRQNAGCLAIWSGTPAPGVENPERWRRLAGVVPFHAGYDGVAIGGFADPIHPWVDDAQGYTRSRSLVYPTASGWISTLAWEAIREAVDDVRYLTLLGTLITRCRNSEHHLVRIEGRRAALWLHLAEVETVNLDTLRLDAIAWILKLQSLLATHDAKATP